MADLSLKIRADFDEAQRQFRALAESSEYTADKIARFTEKFKSESIDKFIDRQKLSAAAMQATGRETDAVKAQAAAYQREIERLIKAGLDPQDAALQKLQTEYAGLLTKQEEAAQAEREKTAAYEAAARKTIELLDASTDYEKKSVELKLRQQELREEIERLVKSGISPESVEVKNLEGKYRDLTREVKANEAAHKAQEAAVKAAQGALLGIGAAMAVGSGFAIKAAAANEDMIASFVPMMNGDLDKATALFKTIQKEAATTPFEIDKIGASVRMLMPAFGGSADAAKDAFRMLGDTAQGNADKLESITKAYTQVMLKGKTSMKEINTIAGAGVPIYTELAKSMGVTEAEMMDMSKKGKITSADLTNAFKNMTSEGGIFFKGMETASDTFNMRLLGIKENVGIAAGAIGEKLLPAAKDIAGAVYEAVGSFAAWIQEGDNFEKLADRLSIVIGAVSTALVTFIAVSKGHAIVSALAVAVKALMTAITGPAGIAAVAIGSVAAGIGLLVARQKEMDRAGERFAATMQKTTDEAESLLDEWKKVNGEKAVDEDLSRRLLLLYPGLAEKIDITAASAEDYARAIKEINYQNATNAADEWKKKLDRYNDALQKIKDSESKFIDTSGLTNWASENKVAILSNTQNAENAVKQMNKVLARIGKEYKDGEYIDIPIVPTVDVKPAEAEIKASTDRITERVKTAIELFQESLNGIKKSTGQELGERINAVQSYLKQRADLERVDGEARIEFFNNQKDMLLEMFREEGQEREAIAAAVAASILETEENMTKKTKEENEKRTKDTIDAQELRAEAYSGLFGSVSSMMDAFNEKSLEVFYFARAMASAEAFVNSYLAFTKALNDPTPMPTAIRAIQAASILASGLAAQANIWKQQPSFETGGSYIVPDVSPRRVDGVGFRAGPGEQIDITPRGMVGQNQGTQIIKLVFDGRELAYAINKLARMGELNTLQLAGNL